MKKLLTSYSMYFNRKNTRSGVLFESRFKARHASTDEYLKYLFAYIHLNPLKLKNPLWKERKINIAKAQAYLLAYPYSSYQEYLGIMRPEKNIISKDEFPIYFENALENKNEIAEWLSFNNEENV